MTIVALILALMAVLLALALGHRARQARRAAFIDRYTYPPGLRHRLRSRYPQLSDAQVETVMLALTRWFELARRAGGRPLSMPSQAVDAAWHEFILFTRNYRDYCRRALGRFLHHTPAEAMRAPTDAQEGIRRAWRLSCAHEGIDPRQPARLPLLFALDAQLGIDDGFHYALDCLAQRPEAARTRGATYCGAHIGCGTGGGSGGCASDNGCSGDGGGCGGGGD